MARKWSLQGSKSSAVDADWLLLVDSADADPATKQKQYSISSLKTDVRLWDIASTYLRPKAGAGYVGVRLYNSDQSQNVRVSYESNGIYYDSTDTAAVHRFWQTLQAETNIKLNNTGALTTAKGINLTNDSANIMLGADDGSIRANINSTAKSHIWSAGTIGSATDNAILSGTGQFRTYKATSAGLSNWAAGVFGDTASNNVVAMGYYPAGSTAMISALNSAQSDYAHLNIRGDGKFLDIDFLATRMNCPLEVDGYLSVTQASAFLGLVECDAMIRGRGDTAALRAQASSNTNRTLDIGFHPSLDICQITATKVGTGIMGLELYGNHLYLQATASSHLEIATSFIDLTSTTTQVTGSAEGIKATSTGVWRGAVIWGSGGTNNVCIGNISGMASMGGNNSNFSAWVPMYIYPQGSANLGIGPFSGGETANAQIHGRTSTILGLPTSAIADASHYASNLSFWVDESGHTLNFKVKYSNGTTVKSGSIALV